MTDVAVLVPRRADGGRRDELWQWVRARWAEEHPTWRVVEGHDDGTGPYNRSLSVNRAAADAGAWDVAILADADSFVPARQAVEAVEVADRTGGIVLAYHRYRYLSHPASDLVLLGVTDHHDDTELRDGVEFTMRDSCSSMVVVPRRLWDQVGGFDERFEGWGWEDVAFSLACQAYGGPIQRVRGDVWHLWHPVSETNHQGAPTLDRNRELVQPYIDAGGDRRRMAEVLAAREVSA